MPRRNDPRPVNPSAARAAWDPRLELWIRPGTSDKDVPADIRNYRELNVQAGDRVLDLGGNIGASVQMWMRAGAAHVTVVEPDPDNAAMLRMNTERYGDKVHVIEAACVRHREKHETLYVNRRKGKDWHSTVPVRGRDTLTVAAVNFQELLNGTQPTRLKIDIEGAEFEIFEGITLPRSVVGLIMEVHLLKKEWREVAAPRLFDEIKTVHGFRYERGPNMTPAAWANTVVAFR